MKLVSYENLAQFMNGLKGLFVQKEAGKGLSTNDYTSQEKTNVLTAYNHARASHAPSNAERNTIERIKRNGTNLSPNSAREIDINVPIKLSDLTNDRGYITSAEASALIQNSQNLRKEIVERLPSPSSAKSNTIYLVAKANAEAGNGYDEYLLIGSAFEHIGDTKTEIDLSAYLKKAELTPITEGEINALLRP